MNSFSLLIASMRNSRKKGKISKRILFQRCFSNTSARFSSIVTVKRVFSCLGNNKLAVTISVTKSGMTISGMDLKGFDHNENWEIEIV